jgi:TDG/mug DNA glycosylase family protein
VQYAFQTLPDLLGDGPLDLVFVGINPSTEAVRQGHYFAGRQNRFWPALSRSRLGRPLCRRLGVSRLEPLHDRHLPQLGIGLTDVVKDPTPNASRLTQVQFQEWAPLLEARLAAHPPRVVCFQGLTGYRPFLRHALGRNPQGVVLGPQPVEVAGAQVWVVPNPSAANAHFRLEDQVAWYDRLAGELGL